DEPHTGRAGSEDHAARVKGPGTDAARTHASVPPGVRRRPGDRRHVDDDWYQARLGNVSPTESAPRSHPCSDGWIFRLVAQARERQGFPGPWRPLAPWRANRPGLASRPRPLAPAIISRPYTLPLAW